MSVDRLVEVDEITNFTHSLRDINGSVQTVTFAQNLVHLTELSDVPGQSLFFRCSELSAPTSRAQGGRSLSYKVQSGIANVRRSLAGSWQRRGQALGSDGVRSLATIQMALSQFAGPSRRDLLRASLRDSRQMAL